MRLRAILFCSAALLGLAVFPSTASAVPLSGTISIANDNSGGVRITPTTIDWFLPLGGGTGKFTVGAPTSGDFAFLLGDTGTVKDLDNGPQPVNAPFPNIPNNSNLPGEGVVLADFLRFDTGAPYGAPAGDIAFDLNFINQGAFTAFFPACATSVPAAGQVCTLPGTPFSLINTTATSSSATFALSGFVRRISTGELSTFNGIYTTQFTIPYQQVLQQLETNGFIDNTYSGTFTGTVTAAVPEPATLLTFGVGTLLAAVRRRRLAKKA